MKDQNLGKTAEDKVTGLKGIITAKAEYLTGCTQYCLLGKVGKDNKPVEGQWFDENRIKIIGKGIDLKIALINTENGGPQSDTPRVR